MTDPRVHKSIGGIWRPVNLSNTPAGLVSSTRYVDPTALETAFPAASSDGMYAMVDDVLYVYDNVTYRPATFNADPSGGFIDYVSGDIQIPVDTGIEYIYEGATWLITKETRAGYQGIDPDLYTVGAEITITGWGFGFVVQDDATTGKWLCPKPFLESVGGSITTAARLTGAIEEDAETPPWVASGTGGSVVSDGTHLTVTMVLATTTALSFSFAGSGPVCVHGLIAWQSVTSALYGRCGLRIQDGDTEGWFCGISTGKYGMGDATTDAAPDTDTFGAGDYSTLGVEHHICAFMLDDTAQIWVNGKIQAVAPAGSGAAPTAREVAFYDFSSIGAAIVPIREMYACAS